jgi:hypothetical protein
VLLLMFVNLVGGGGGGVVVVFIAVGIEFAPARC